MGELGVVSFPSLVECKDSVDHVSKILHRAFGLSYEGWAYRLWSLLSFYKEKSFKSSVGGVSRSMADQVL